MLAVFADTHATERPKLSAAATTAIADADLVVHAGDFTSSSVYDAFEQRADRLVAVHGNSDASALRDRLPAVRTIEWAGRTVLVVHGHHHTQTSLPLLAREREADLAIVGHTHRPDVEWIGDLPVVNPGSHADPRGGPPTHATLRGDAESLTVAIRSGEGKTVHRQRLAECGEL